MYFKEYFEKELLEDLFVESLIEEGVWDVVTAPIRAVGGAATNYANQTRRGLWRGTKGVGKLGYGLGQMGLGALKTVTGSPGKGFKDALEGGKTALSGASDVVAGAVQAGAAPATAAARGVQASLEPMKIAKFDPKASGFQKFFGLNSWRTPEEISRDNRGEFDRLLRVYANSRTKQEKLSIRQELKKIDINRYNALVKKAAEKAKAKAAQRATPPVDSMGRPLVLSDV